MIQLSNMVMKYFRFQRSFHVLTNYLLWYDILISFSYKDGWNLEQNGPTLLLCLQKRNISVISFCGYEPVDWTLVFRQTPHLPLEPKSGQQLAQNPKDTADRVAFHTGVSTVFEAVAYVIHRLSCEVNSGELFLNVYIYTLIYSDHISMHLCTSLCILV